jgi:hypothetical protein
MGLPDLTVETCPAEENRVNDYPRSRLKPFVPFHDLANHLMPHDERVAHRDTAPINLQVCTTDTAVGDADEELVIRWDWS